MRIIRTAIKAGIITKLVQEARKPHNQDKLRDLWDRVTNKAQPKTTR